MEMLEYSVIGIPPFSCKGKGTLIVGEKGSAFICTDQAGTASQNVQGFVSKVRNWLSENGHDEATAADVFLHYPEEISLCGKEYFLPIAPDDSLGDPMNRTQFISAVGCSEKDLPSSN